jgi:hypothetical protein
LLDDEVTKDEYRERLDFYRARKAYREAAP